MAPTHVHLLTLAGARVFAVSHVARARPRARARARADRESAALYRALYREPYALLRGPTTPKFRGLRVVESAFSEAPEFS